MMTPLAPGLELPVFTFQAGESDCCSSAVSIRESHAKEEQLDAAIAANLGRLGF